MWSHTWYADLLLQINEEAMLLNARNSPRLLTLHVFSIVVIHVFQEAEYMRGAQSAAVVVYSSRAYC